MLLSACVNGINVLIKDRLFQKLSAVVITFTSCNVKKRDLFLAIIIVDPINFENAASNSIINVRLNSGPT